MLQIYKKGYDFSNVIWTLRWRHVVTTRQMPIDHTLFSHGG